VFHWPKSEIEALDINELRMWRELAVTRWNLMHGRKGEGE
jgi:hypothetical protein